MYERIAQVGEGGGSFPRPNSLNSQVSHLLLLTITAVCSQSRDLAHQEALGLARVCSL